jgi:hypothetical protein
MPAVWGDRPSTLRTLPRPTRLSHHPPRLGTAPGTPRSREWSGQAPTALTGARVSGNRLDSGDQGDCLRIDFRRGLPWQVCIKSTAADLEHPTEHRYWPGALMLGNKGIP